MTNILFSGPWPLLLFLAKATLVLILAVAATFVLRRSTAGERHLVWLAALVGVLALPVLSRIPALQLSILPSRLAPSTATLDGPPRVIVVDGPTTTIVSAPAAPIVAGTYESTRITVTPPTAVAIAGSGPAMASIEMPATPPVLGDVSSPMLAGSVLKTLVMVWGAVALSLLAWLAFGALQVRRIVSNAMELTSPDWTMPLCEVADRLDLEQPPQLVMSDRIEMAFACRVLAPTVVLPAAAAHWTDDRRRAVLFHELAHVKRHDLVSHTLARVACALYWFHPLVWAAARNLRNESEKACDDLVLSCGARASEYAQHLLDMITSVRNHGAPALGIPMARKKEFEGRMLAILDPAIRRASHGKAYAALVIAGVSALSLTIAAVSPAQAHTDANIAAADTLPIVAVASTEQTPPAAPVTEATTAIDAVAPRPATPRAAGRGEGAAVAPSAESWSEAMAASTAPAAPSASTGISPSATPAPMSFGRGDDLGRALGVLANTVAKGTLEGLGLTTPHAHGAVADTGRIALLIKVLETDTDADVRRAAAWGLSDINTSGARTALARALQSDADGQVREMAAWSLAEQGSQDAAGTLANALIHDKNVKVRQTSAWGLGQLGRRADADALVSALSDADAQVRETAIWALGQVDLRRAPPTLINALGDNAPRVREIAAWTLGQIGDTAAVRPLARAFQSETDTQTKRMYLWSLTEIGDAPTDLIESAMKSSDPELRRHAVGLLTGSGSAWPMPMPRPMPRPRP